MQALAIGALMTLLLLVNPLAALHVSAQAKPVSSAALIGEWRGTMTPRGGTAGRDAVRAGDYVLTISAVNGDVVRGKVTGPDAASSGTFRGTLEGDTLHFSTGTTKTQLTIKGESMEGMRQSQGRAAWTLSLRKKQ